MKSSHKLEMIYLMNVSLFLKTKYDIKEFIQINKKCHLAISSLKTTPPQFDRFSTEWFFDKFSPDTLDRNYLCVEPCECDFKAKLIRYPNYNIKKVKHISNVVELFHKVSHLFMERNLKESNSKFFQLMIENATQFTQLQRIEGRIEYLFEFFKSYTKDKTEMNVPFPRVISINRYTDKNDYIPINESTICQIERLLEYIRKDGDIKIIIHFDREPNTDEERQLIRRLNNVFCVYDNYLIDDTERNEQYFSYRLNYLYFENCHGNNSINETITKYYPHYIKCVIDAFDSDDNNNTFNYFEEREIWNIPEFVKELILSKINVNENNQPTEISQQSDKVKEMIEDGKYQLFIDTNNLEILRLWYSNKMRLNNHFDCLKYLELYFCEEVNIKEINGNPIDFPSLETLSITHSTEIDININAPKIEVITVYMSENIKLRGEIDTVKRLYLMNVHNGEIEWMNLLEKDGVIEESDNLIFKKGDEVKLPYLEEIMSLEEFNECCNSLFDLTNKNIDVNSITKIFRMRSFGFIKGNISYYDNKNQFIIENNNNIMTKSHFNPFLFQWICRNKHEEMEILRENEKIIVPDSIRYFEVKLCGYNEVVIGLSFIPEFDYKNCPLGYSEGTVGLLTTSSSTFINGNKTDHKGTEMCFGNCVIGCGYDIRTGEVFFTKDGIKIWEKLFLNTKSKCVYDTEENELGVAIQIYNVSKLEINTGRKPFVYDLRKEYEEGKGKENCQEDIPYINMKRFKATVNIGVNGKDGELDIEDLEDYYVNLQKETLKQTMKEYMKQMIDEYVENYVNKLFENLK